MSGEKNKTSYVTKISSVLLELEKGRHIEQFFKALKFETPHSYHSASQTIAQGVSLSRKGYFVPQRDMEWMSGLGSTPMDRSGTGFLQDITLVVSQQTTDGNGFRCPEYGGLLAAEVPITDVWRLIASFNLHYTNSTNEPNTPTEIHVCDLWVSVPDALLGKPLVHMDFRPGTSFPGYDTPLIPRTLQTRFAAGWVWHLKSAVPVGRCIRAKHPAGKELGCPVPSHSHSSLSKLDVIFQSKPRRRKQGRSPCRKSATTCGIMLTLSIALGMVRRSKSCLRGL